MTALIRFVLAVLAGAMIDDADLDVRSFPIASIWFLMLINTRLK
jgi:hypothetical protein